MKPPLPHLLLSPHQKNTSQASDSHHSSSQMPCPRRWLSPRLVVSLSSPSTSPPAPPPPIPQLLIKCWHDKDDIWWFSNKCMKHFRFDHSSFSPLRIRELRVLRVGMVAAAAVELGKILMLKDSDFPVPFRFFPTPPSSCSHASQSTSQLAKHTCQDKSQFDSICGVLWTVLEP